MVFIESSKDFGARELIAAVSADLRGRRATQVIGKNPRSASLKPLPCCRRRTLVRVELAPLLKERTHHSMTASQMAFLDEEAVLSYR
jgi:hypothetical protein